MGNNVGIAIFIFQALLALFAFFVTAPMTLNAISLFGVQKRFAEEMIKPVSYTHLTLPTIA